MSITESFSDGGYIDLDELRSLYYGRYNVYVSFSNNVDFDLKPDSTLDRPYGILAHQVNDVVGKKIRIPKEFYAHVFRPNRSGGEFIENVRNYTKTQLEEDLKKIRALEYLEEETVEEIIETVLADNEFRTDFQRMWNITRMISEASARSAHAKFWRKVLVDMDYSGFADPNGTGILGKGNEPTAIFVDINVNRFDIVPIQKYRVDKRQRVWDQIEKQTRLEKPDRNRIAKRRTPVSRKRENNNGKFDL